MGVCIPYRLDTDINDIKTISYHRYDSNKTSMDSWGEHDKKAWKSWPFHKEDNSVPHGIILLYNRRDNFDEWITWRIE